MFSWKGNDGKGLLIFAVLSGGVEMFKAVMVNISNKLTAEEVRRCTVGKLIR